jgi:hypothetical protein
MPCFGGYIPFKGCLTLFLAVHHRLQYCILTSPLSAHLCCARGINVDTLAIPLMFDDKTRRTEGKHSCTQL